MCGYLNAFSETHIRKFIGEMSATWQVMTTSAMITTRSCVFSNRNS
jgi:hypothetical protein